MPSSSAHSDSKSGHYGAIGGGGPVGTPETRLAVIRGNSGSGKSSISLAIREHYGRGVAWVSQDLLRRTVLREWDVPGAANVGLIELTARYALDQGFHVIVDGILYAPTYGEMLRRLHRDHRGRTGFFYLDVAFEETARRHATRPQAAEFTTEQMREWYQRRDLLDAIDEEVIPERSTLEQSVDLILDRMALRRS